MRLDNFSRNNIIMFLAGVVSSFFSLLYQLIMLRLVSREVFSSLNSLLSLLAIISVPAMAFGTMVTKYVSALNAKREMDNLRCAWQKLSTHILIFSFILFLVIFFSRHKISAFLNIDSVASVIMLAFIFFLVSVTPITNGGLQGLEKFGWLAFLVALGGFLKLILSFFLVKSLPEALFGALLGLLLSFLAVILLGLLPLRILLRRSSFQGTASTRQMYLFVMPVSLVLLCFSILTNIDMILVKHFFIKEAGPYAVSQMIGKIILFVPGMVYMVMFSRVSGLHATGKATRHILIRGILFTLYLSLIAVLGYNLFPRFSLNVLVGNYDTNIILLGRFFSFTMCFHALNNILFYYQLSVEKYDFLKPLAALTVLQVIMTALFHRTPFWVIGIAMVNSVVIFVFNLISAARASGEKHERH